MRVGIVGCGLIGGKRAAALDGDDRLVATYDLAIDRAIALAGKYKDDESLTEICEEAYRRRDAEPKE